MATLPPNAPLHLPALTGFRALAAAMVLVGHIENARRLEAPWFAHYGWTGVNLFFALSGFLFTLLYFDRLAEGTVSLRNYLLKRVFRVLPLTWFLVFVSFVTWPQYTAGDVLTHLTLTQAYFDEYRFSMNPPMWTLCVEESFYLIVPPLFIALGALDRIRPKSSTAARLAILALSLFLLTKAGMAIAIDLMTAKQRLTGQWDNYVWVMTIFGRFSDFAWGIGAGVVALRPASSRWLQNRVVANGLVALGLGVWWATAVWLEARGGADKAWVFPWYQLVSRLFAASGALVILGLYGRSIVTPVFASAPFVYAGRISFALYLVQDAWIEHVPVSEILAGYVRNKIGPESYAVIALYAATSVAAALLYHGVEDPAQRYLRRRFLRGAQ